LIGIGFGFSRKPLPLQSGHLTAVLKRARPGLALNDHFEDDGAIIFREAYRLGFEGIVSKRPRLCGEKPRMIGAGDPWLGRLQPHRCFQTVPLLQDNFF
jgi:hypothetical protein